tara:strand:- start:58 stop:1092 length:1035 start_codon:yes stop_codon:yes gene_type:complete
MFFLFVFIIFSSFIIFYLSKKINLAFDNEFSKPQAIHLNSIPRILGINILFIFLFLFFNQKLINHDYFIILIISIICSLPGFLDDFGLKTNPYIRFSYQIISVTSVVIFFEFVGLLEPFEFLPNFLSNNLFMTFFTIFSILTIANSINFIDGCNGLVNLYMILLSSILYLFSNDFYLKQYCLIILIYLSITLFYNFPKANAFIGDFGAYFLGFNISFLIIYINTNNISFTLDVNEWFFACLLAYPSFEIFSTILRRLKNKKSPFYPDNRHLHSIIYQILTFKFIPLKANYFTSIVILTLNLLFFSILLFLPVDLFYIGYFLFFLIFYFLRLILFSFLNKLLLQK